MSRGLSFREGRTYDVLSTFAVTVGPIVAIRILICLRWDDDGGDWLHHFALGTQKRPELIDELREAPAGANLGN